MKQLKRNIRNFAIFFVISFIVIVLNFGVHYYRTKIFNSTERFYDSSSTSATISVDIHERGKTTDSWVKNDAFDDGTLLYGTVYECVITNKTQSKISNWNLRINITEDCYLNSAWCGTVEIHQFVDDKEKIQTLDLRNYDDTALKLDGYVAGSDLLIPLSDGDYIIYYPDESAFEYPIASSEDYNGTATTGLIFYSKTDKPMTFNDYLLSYMCERDYFRGTEAKLFSILFPLWILSLVFFIISAFAKLDYEKRLNKQNEIIKESLEVFSYFVDAKDTYTYGHSERVSRFSKLIAEKMGLSEDESTKISYQALLHDIGKVFIPDEILKKPANLTEEEFEIVKTHPMKGVEILKNFNSIPDISDGARYHHECFDGSGYPVGLKGQEIPLCGRIIAVADFYDAVRSDRTYKSHLTKQEAIDELLSLTGTHFDPEVVKIFLEVLEEDRFPDTYN